MFPCMDRTKYFLAKSWRPEVGVWQLQNLHGNGSAWDLPNVHARGYKQYFNTKSYSYVRRSNELRGKTPAEWGKTSRSLLCLNTTNSFLKTNEAT